MKKRATGGHINPLYSFLSRRAGGLKEQEVNRSRTQDSRRFTGAGEQEVYRSRSASPDNVEPCKHGLVVVVGVDEDLRPQDRDCRDAAPGHEQTPLLLHQENVYGDGEAEESSEGPAWAEGEK